MSENILCLVVYQLIKVKLADEYRCFDDRYSNSIKDELFNYHLNKATGISTET